MPGAGERILSFDTAKTVLVPAGSYEAGIESDYLRFNGMALSADEVAVASRPNEGMVAIMGIPAAVWNKYREEYERGEVGVTSPLLSVATGDGWGRSRDVNIYITPQNVYLAVLDKGLRMAEALPDNSVDSLLYYMQVVGRSFRLRKFDINVGGEKAGLACDTLRRYYRNVKIKQGIIV